MNVEGGGQDSGEDAPKVSASHNFVEFIKDQENEKLKAFYQRQATI